MVKPCLGPLDKIFMTFHFSPKSLLMRTLLATYAIFFIAIFVSCNQPTVKSASTPDDPSNANVTYGGFETQERWGEHLVTIAACHDCHTPKKMTAQGMELDSSLLLSGHPGQPRPLAVDRKEMENKGYVVTNDLTTWVGPWGVSYTANLTSDESGIGNWTEQQFFKAIREGKYKGMDNTRPLLPPMPWPMYKNMTDDELKAIFAYMKSTKPVKNIVPSPQPPVAAAR